MEKNEYTKYQLDEGEKIMKKTMLPQEISNYDALTQEQQEQYVSGFLDNIKEWKKAYLASNTPAQNQQPGMNPPDDGLRHWQSKENSKLSNDANAKDQRKVIHDDRDNTEYPEQQNNKNNSENQSGANAANQAQAAADAAQSAAEAAQAAANNAQNNSQNSNNSTAQNAANQAQTAADAAQAAAEAAQNAAEAAAQAAQQAQNAAESGNMNSAQQAAAQAAQAAAEAAQNAANQAQSAAQTAQQAANQAQSAAESGNTNSAQQAAAKAAQAAAKAAEAASQAANATEQTNNNAQAANDNGEYNSSTKNSHSERNMPTLGDAKTKSSYNGAVEKNVDFGGNDLLPQSDYKKFKEIAERAGQQLDPEDYENPEQSAAAKYKEAMSLLKQWRGSKQPGVGNSPIDLVDTITKLFSSKLNWKQILKRFMKEKENIAKEPAMTKRYMGLDPSHPKYAGRYLHPRETLHEKNSTIAQVFFLVDASGSMSQICGDGTNVFEHIMSELVTIDYDAKIKKSAFAAFNVGRINEKDVITWNWQDARNKNAIIKRLPMPSASGGTSALDAIDSINDLKKLYDPRQTLLIIVTDGYDDYSNIKQVMSSTQMKNTVFLLVNQEDDYLNKIKGELINKGIKENHIITVNSETEWS